MTKKEYIRQLKKLIKKYHPDLCKDEYLEKEYHEITIKLTGKLDQLHSGSSAVKTENQDYEYYRQGIKYYRKIHPDQFLKRKEDNTYVPGTYNQQMEKLNEIFISFNSALYFFGMVLSDYPGSPWADDAKDKLVLLNKLQKIYSSMNIENHNQIIDSNKFVEEMGFKII